MLQATVDETEQVERDHEQVADSLYGLLRETYGDDVHCVINQTTIMISRGERAARIQVLADRLGTGKRYLVSIRRHETFHMHPEPVGMEGMTSLVERMVGKQPEPASAEPRPSVSGSVRGLPRLVLARYFRRGGSRQEPALPRPASPDR